MAMLRQRKIPLRKCVGCQQMFPKQELIRVVVTPENDIQLDWTSRRNGRGAYLCRNPDCLRTAKKKKSLDRALKVSVPDLLYDQLTNHLEEGIRHGPGSRTS
jgi:predicted RNA-binding protein YlxR (DUF448 family)